MAIVMGCGLILFILVVMYGVHTSVAKVEEAQREELKFWLSQTQKENKVEFIPTADEAYAKSHISARALAKEEVRELILDAIDAGQFQVVLKKPLHLDVRRFLENQGYMVSEIAISWGHYHDND